jgi:general stress protein CsbA
MGAAFVYVGAYVAPAFKRRISLAMAILLLILGGASILAALMTHSYISVVAAVCMDLGAIMMARDLYERQHAD